MILLPVAVRIGHASIFGYCHFADLPNFRSSFLNLETWENGDSFDSHALSQVMRCWWTLGSAGETDPEIWEVNESPRLIVNPCEGKQKPSALKWRWFGSQIRWKIKKWDPNIGWFPQLDGTLISFGFWSKIYHLPLIGENGFCFHLLFQPNLIGNDSSKYWQWQFQDLEQTWTSNHSIPRKFLGKTVFCNIVLLWKPVQGYGVSHRFPWFYRHFIAISALFPWFSHFAHDFPLIFHVKSPEPRSSLPPEVWQRHHTPIFEPGLWADVSKMILMAKLNKDYDFGYNGYDYHYF